ncbi:serine/threonine-protein kinase [Nocardia sp. CDC160]|uniref:serine/threonine-protein kinase n=1 Tax=Nocardia sp. CDC160 TaxID=3112166 RepID=UPI002DB9B633|nr:serine/threonine-protein kinase [Nocardia sp. CDC160]MEC3918054.1 serine/threonine-protein kinase [Nocardia sp. CDC160]
MVLVPGTVFAGFTIEALLGRGGMGEVYRARHPRLPRRVAIKVLTDAAAQDRAFRTYFDREADLAARAHHRNIVTVFDRGIEDGRPWICMEFIDGTDVAALLRHHRSGLPLPQALHILTQAAAGIDHAHRQGLLHRDIKPANILLAPGDPGEPDRVLVSDFGIARLLDQSTALTATGSFLATLAYAPPETYTDTPVGRPGDLYSLGATLFEMLTGSVPFPRANPAAIMHAHLFDPPPKPSDLRAGLPLPFDAVLATALAKNPADRFPTARALAAAATAALPPSAPTTTLARPVATRPNRSHGRQLVGWGLAITAVAGIALAYNTLRTHPTDLPPCPTTETQPTPTDYPAQPTAPPLGVPAATTTPVPGVNCRVVH